MSLGVRIQEFLSVRKRASELGMLRDLVAPSAGLRLLDVGGGAGAAACGGAAATNWAGIVPSTSPLDVNPARSESLIWSGTNVYELPACTRYNVPSLP